MYTHPPIIRHTVRLTNRNRSAAHHECHTGEKRVLLLSKSAILNCSLKHNNTLPSNMSIIVRSYDNKNNFNRLSIVRQDFFDKHLIWEVLWWGELGKRGCRIKPLFDYLWPPFIPFAWAKGGLSLSMLTFLTPFAHSSSPLHGQRVGFLWRWPPF